MLQIHDMKKENLEQVAAIERDSFSMPWSLQSFEEALDNPNAFYVVAEENGQVAGYCGAYLILDEADVNQVAVRPSCRNRGIGKKIMKALLLRLERAGAAAVTLEVRQSNKAAAALYESLGFATEGIRKNFYEKPVEDALIMWKR